jgi:hypothetical protein
VRAISARGDPESRPTGAEAQHVARARFALDNAGNWQLSALGPAPIAGGKVVFSPASGSVLCIGPDKRVDDSWGKNAAWQLDWVCV